jgi:hypothetical protein
MIDCHKLGLFRRGYDARVQLFACSHAFYDRVLRGANREMNSSDVRLLEHLIYRKVIPFKGQPGYTLRFPCNMDPVGTFGFKNRRYDSPRTAISRSVRALLRVDCAGLLVLKELSGNRLDLEELMPLRGAMRPLERAPKTIQSKNASTPVSCLGRSVE